MLRRNFALAVMLAVAASLMLADGLLRRIATTTASPTSGRSVITCRCTIKQGAPGPGPRRPQEPRRVPRAPEPARRRHRQRRHRGRRRARRHGQLVRRRHAHDRARRRRHADRRRSTDDTEVECDDDAGDDRGHDDGDDDHHGDHHGRRRRPVRAPRPGRRRRRPSDCGTDALAAGAKVPRPS